MVTLLNFLVDWIHECFVGPGCLLIYILLELGVEVKLLVYNIYYLLLKKSLLFEFCSITCSIIWCLLFKNLIGRWELILAPLSLIIELSQISIFVFLIINLTFTLNSFSWVPLLNKFHIIQMGSVLLLIIILVDVACSC